MSHFIFHLRKLANASSSSSLSPTSTRRKAGTGQKSRRDEEMGIDKWLVVGL